MRPPLPLLLLLCASLPAAEPPTIGELLGLTVHPAQTAPARYAPVARQVRVVHPLAWDVGETPQLLPAFPLAGNGFDWQVAYDGWRSAGFTTCTALLFEPLRGEHWVEPERQAFAYGLAFARSFGPSATKPLTGAVEVGDPPGTYERELHRQLFIGLSRGLRQGDAKLRIATGPVTTGPGDRSLRSIEEFRGLDRAFDAFTVPADAEIEGWPTWKRTYPEDPATGFLANVRAVCAWRDRVTPGKAVWVTDIAWDCTTARPDPLGPWARWEGSTDQQQAQWLVRSALLFATMPVERVYFRGDDDKNEAGRRLGSGVTRKTVPKPSFHALAHLQTTLGDYRFAGIVRLDAGVAQLRFIHARDAKKQVVVAWSPTGDDRVVELTVPVQPGVRLTRLQYMPLSAEAVDLPLPAVQNGMLTVTLRESPLYGWVEMP